MARTAIILLNWNGWKDTISCIESLLLSDSADFVVIVCDNGSTDDSWSRLQAWCKTNVGEEFEIWAPGLSWTGDARVVLIETGGNLGFAGGCNVGIRFALQQTKCEYLWLLNNDTLVERTSLSSQVARMQGNGSLGLLGSTLVYDDAAHSVQCFGGYGFNFWTGRVRPFRFGADRGVTPAVSEVERRIRYVSGASTFTTRQFVDQVGLLNEQYFLYFEEIDWAVRGRKFRMSFCPESVVIHKEGRSIGSASSASGRSRQSELWLTRNRVLFMRTHFPARLPTVILWVLSVALIRGCTLGPRHMSVLLRGLWNGLRAPIQAVPQLSEWRSETLKAAERYDGPAPDNCERNGGA